MPTMRGLARLAVVGFTVVSLLLVGVVGVSATSSSGKADSVNVVNSLTALFSGHHDQTGTGNSSTVIGANHGKDLEVGQCKPPKKHHKHGTPGHKHHQCGDRDDDSD
jgi:hypothetical protein